MAPPTFKGAIEVGVTILRTTVDAATKAILAQLGESRTEESIADGAEWWQHVGFISRPSKAVPKGESCEGIVVRRSGNDVVISSRDKRGRELAGELKEGETCLYAAGPDGKGQSRVLLKANGAIALYTREGNTEAGQGMAVILDPMTDTVSVTNSLGFGLIISPDGVRLTSKEGGLTLTAGGDCTMAGTGKTQVDGSSVLLGSVAVPGVNNAITGPTGVAGKASVKVMIE